jgi:hypothetical protein
VGHRGVDGLADLAYAGLAQVGFGGGERVVHDPHDEQHDA